MAEGKSCASVNSEYLGASELVEMYQKAYRDALITAAQLEQRLDPCGISQLQGQPYTRAYLAMVLNLPPNADEETVSRMAQSSPVAGILEKNFPTFFSKKKIFEPERSVFVTYKNGTIRIFNKFQHIEAHVGIVCCRKTECNRRVQFLSLFFP